MGSFIKQRGGGPSPRRSLSCSNSDPAPLPLRMAGLPRSRPCWCLSGSVQSVFKIVPATTCEMKSVGEARKLEVGGEAGASEMSSLRPNLEAVSGALAFCFGSRATASPGTGTAHDRMMDWSFTRLPNWHLPRHLYEDDRTVGSIRSSGAPSLAI